MIIGTILLTYDDVYVSKDNKLPKRNSIDKHLLKEICRNKKVSPEGYKLLPNSIQSIVNISQEYEVAITIKELNKCDLLIVNRSDDNIEGKIFRFDNFDNIYIKEALLKYGVKNTIYNY